ncbi:MAG: Uma2 family endonuclease [Planctomycetes bacterium]|nr:Uma2 family endonuclease [Planctomycetota bacterium]
MSSAEKSTYHSVEEYLAIEEQAQTKSEYIDGWIRAMTGATNRHNCVKINCLVHLVNQLRGQPCRPFDSDTKVRIDREGLRRFYYPDVQVVCQSNDPLSVFQDHPVLIIEVLSPSTRRYDLDEKMAAYLNIHSLECYIAIEQHQPIAVVMRRSTGGFLRQTVHGIEATIDLPFLGCTLPMQQIYEGIEFTAECVQEPDPEYELSEGP